MEKYIVLLAACSFVAIVSAYSGGAPVEVCDDMLPQHPVSPQTSKLPYTLQATKSSASPGDRIKITITGNGGKPFKGLLVQGRKGDEIIGSFDVSDSDKYIKTINCPKGTKNAVTHKNNEDKKSITVDYIVPNIKGQITFYATVAENGGVFWVKQPTAKINVK